MKQKFTWLRAGMMSMLAFTLLTLGACSQQDVFEDEAADGSNEEIRKFDKLGGITDIITDPIGRGEGNKTLRLGVEYELSANCIMLWSLSPNPEFSFTVAKGDDLPSEYEIHRVNSDKAKVKFYKPGIYNITVRCTNYDRPALTQRFSVPALEPWIEGPKEVELGKFYDFKITCWNPGLPNPLFRIVVEESLLGTGNSIINKMSNNRYRICFNEPGAYHVIASITNGPNLSQGLYNVSVFYKPYYKIEKKATTPAIIPKDPTKIDPIKVPVGTGDDLTIIGTRTIYENTLYFYADAACTQPLTLQHDVIFDCYMDYSLTQGDICWNEAGTNTRMVVQKGVSSVKLPRTVKTVKNETVNGQIVKQTKDPYYHIVYPDDSCSEYNPYK